VIKRPVLLLCVLLLVLSGCLLPRSTKPMVKIGLIAPFEGRYRTLGYSVLHAVKWTVQQRNKQGGIAGTMVKVVALNDGAEPAASAVQVRALAVDADVVGVIGPFTEATAVAAAPVFAELALPAVTPVTCPGGLSASGPGSVFCLGASAADVAETLGARVPTGARVTLLREEDGQLGAQLAPLAQRILEGPFRAQFLAELEGDPADLYLYDGDVLFAAELLQQLRTAGVETPFWGGPDLARRQFALIAGDGVRGACHALTVPFLADLDPSSSFYTGYQGLAGRSPGPWAALAYDATTVLLDAIEREIVAQGTASRAGVRRRLQQATGPGGEPLFDPWGRRGAEVVLCCYDRREEYPGHPFMRSLAFGPSKTSRH
jgi:branched-chain amino acid transport system substrate-binding protein